VKPRISEDSFAVLMAQTGLTLTPAQRRDIYDAYGLVEAMRDRVHAPLPRAAEPSLTFKPHGDA
jgi:hypothetical protein